MLIPTFRFFSPARSAFRDEKKSENQRCEKGKKKTMGAGAKSPQAERKLSTRRRLSDQSHVLLKAERDKQVALGDDFGRARARGKVSRELRPRPPVREASCPHCVRVHPGRQSLPKGCRPEGRADPKVAYPKVADPGTALEKRGRTERKQMLTDGPRSIENSCRRTSERLKAERIPASETTASTVI